MPGKKLQNSLQSSQKINGKPDLTYCIRDEEVVAQEAVVQHGGDEPLQPCVAPVRAQGAHLDKQREVAGSAETTQALRGFA